jgi:hypothetical protein
VVIEINSFVPLATILGAAAAPTIAAIWAEGKRAKDALRAADYAAIAALKVAEVKDATIIAAKKVSEVKDTLVQTASNTDGQLKQIHSLVNNQLTQAVQRFEQALKEIESLKSILKDRSIDFEDGYGRS